MTRCAPSARHGRKYRDADIITLFQGDKHDYNREALYRDPTQPVAARVQGLLARMTLQEKAGQMSTFSVGGLEGLFGNLPKDEAGAFMVRLGAP